jgi:tetratricopeptide (TPR) repeat protein
MGVGLVLNRTRQVPAEETPAFGAIAERFRRAGDLARAVALCRDGLQKFPDHLSARVTLGWALLDQGQYDDARVELQQVLKRAPDNLAAIRGLAELHDRAENTVELSLAGPGPWPPEPSAIESVRAATASHAPAVDAGDALIRPPIEALDAVEPAVSPADVETIAPVEVLGPAAAYGTAAAEAAEADLATPFSSPFLPVVEAPSEDETESAFARPERVDDAEALAEAAATESVEPIADLAPIAAMAGLEADAALTEAANALIVDEFVPAPIAAAELDSPAGPAVFLEETAAFDVEPALEPLLLANEALDREGSVTPLGDLQGDTIDDTSLEALLASEAHAGTDPYPAAQTERPVVDPAALVEAVIDDEVPAPIADEADPFFLTPPPEEMAAAVDLALASAEDAAGAIDPQFSSLAFDFDAPAPVPAPAPLAAAVPAPPPVDVRQPVPVPLPAPVPQPVLQSAPHPVPVIQPVAPMLLRDADRRETADLREAIELSISAPPPAPVPVPVAPAAAAVAPRARQVPHPAVATFEQMLRGIAIRRIQLSAYNLAG